MTDTEWDEVGQRFAELGRRLQRHWEEVPDATGRADEEVRTALADVGAALDRLGGAITEGVHDAEVREAATSATAGVIDAMSTSLNRLAQRVDRRGDAKD